MTNQQHKNRIPEFSNRQEMAEWFDTHDIADYQDVFKTVESHIALEKTKQETIVVRIHKGVKDQLASIARAKGLNISSLARMWLMEHLQEKIKAA